MEVGDSMLTERRKHINLCIALRELGFRAVTRSVDKHSTCVWKMSKEETPSENGASSANGLNVATVSEN